MTAAISKSWTEWDGMMRCILLASGVVFASRSSKGGINKKISGIENKAKKVPRVFFKIGVRGPKQKLSWGQTPPPSPILRIPFSSEIDPLGVYRLSLARHALDSGFTVARGQHSHLPL